MDSIPHANDQPIGMRMANTFFTTRDLPTTPPPETAQGPPGPTAGPSETGSVDTPEIRPEPTVQRLPSKTASSS
eukprot:2693138-Alexandrium_andersonii.AAC.1